MPRYFFHYRTDAELIRDTDGTDLVDLAAAERNAAELGRAIVDRAASFGEDCQLPRSIEITDAAGEDLLYVVFWGSLEPEDITGPVVKPSTLH
mgnify:CR=1 FL=1